jgi:hypothetical protein
MIPSLQKKRGEIARPVTLPATLGESLPPEVLLFTQSVAVLEVRDNISDRVELQSSQIGDLAFYEGTPAKV